MEVFISTLNTLFTVVPNMCEKFSRKLGMPGNDIIVTVLLLHNKQPVYSVELVADGYY